MRRLIGTALVASSIALLPSIARAGTVVSTAPSCTGGSLNICMEFDLENTGGENYSLTLILDSINGGALNGAGFSSFALFGDPVNGTFTGVNAGPAGWGFGGCQDLSPLAGIYVCDNDNGAKATDITFTFTYTGNSSDLSFSNVGAHIQGITQLGGNCSAKVAVTPDETADFYAGAPTDCGPGTTTTPEPASFVLMGTGLVGLGGIGAIRRRRRS